MTAPWATAAIVAGALLIVVAAVRIARDRRRPESSIPLVIGTVMAYLGVTGRLYAVGYEDVALVMGAGMLMFVVAPAAPAIAAAAVWNGVVVLRREGLRPANALPLLLGMGMVAGPAALALIAGWFGATSVYLGVLALLLGYAYLGFLLVVYSVHALLYARWPLPRRLDAVVVLGAGLVGDKVTPLLGGRVERGMDVARKVATDSGGSPIVVMSGGQGPDEVVAEATAMSRHALGLPGTGADAMPEILEEDRSTTTDENLRFSAELLAARGFGPDARVMVVTSDFHVLRAAELARRQGLDWQVAGSPTSRYYVPTAFLREYVAWLSLNARTHAVVFGAIAVVAAAVPLL